MQNPNPQSREILCKVHCPSLPPRECMSKPPYQRGEGNLMYQGKPKSFTGNPNRAPETSSTTELNDWLKQPRSYHGRRGKEYPTIPDYLMQQALANPGSVDFDTWLAAME